MNIRIIKSKTDNELQKCLSIRQQVFVIEQKVPLAEELDGKDEESDHYLLLVDDKPVGVARVRYDGHAAKIERVAVLSDYQGEGLGKRIMKEILDNLRIQKTVQMAKLSAQTYAIPFYEKLGFHVCSEEYLDANIPHKDMIMSLRSVS